MNQGLSATYLYEVNERIITDIYLSTVAKGENKFTPSQKETIYQIAIQCPYSGGPAVYFARGLYLESGEIFMNDDSLCNEQLNQPQIESTIINNFPSTNFKFYPNPTKSQITLIWDNFSQEMGDVQFRNSLGILICQKKVSLNKGIEIIDIPQIPSGVYIITLKLVHSSQELGKLVIIN